MDRPGRAIKREADDRGASESGFARMKPVARADEVIERETQCLQLMLWTALASKPCALRQ
jgi:hypothetical protein